MRVQPDFGACIDKHIQQRLGTRLRALYSGVVADPVPQDQIELVLAIRRAERDRRPAAQRP